ncbi:hypothetical protein B0H17DRAFT_1129879 [Mycena rosella]|uniref:Secreted protein n=1 Tax=Mycena rosella TaxID=1033263 RepID=A0AAD7DUI5_MYCRO|nr:hypothetical protein B0H17DRAFT_1129879 [Mycena rosella]
MYVFRPFLPWMLLLLLLSHCTDFCQYFDDDDDYPMQPPLPDNGPLLEYISSDGTLCVPSDRTPTFALPSALPSETAVEDPAVVDPVLPSEDPMILDRTPDAASDGLPTDIPISADV